MMRYCSEIPLSQYPQMLQLNSTDREALDDLHEMTDGFSIDVLKVIEFFVVDVLKVGKCKPLVCVFVCVFFFLCLPPFFHPPPPHPPFFF